MDNYMEYLYRLLFGGGDGPPDALLDAKGNPIPETTEDTGAAAARARRGIVDDSRIIIPMPREFMLNLDPMGRTYRMWEQELIKTKSLRDLISMMQQQQRQSPNMLRQFNGSGI